MQNDVSDHFDREVLGSVTSNPKPINVPEQFKQETLGVVHPGHEAVVALDPEYFAALQNYYSTWTISRKDAVLPRGVMEFIITGISDPRQVARGASAHSARDAGRLHTR